MKSSRRLRIDLSAIVILAVLAIALAMGFVNLSGYLMNDDEETYLYDAWRVSLGELPYRDFALVQTPLSFFLVGAVFKVFGPSVWFARALSYLFVMGAVVIIYAAARRVFGFSRLVALASAGIFLFSKHVYFLGRSFMPDCAMLFFAAASLLFALKAEDGSGDGPSDPHTGQLFLFGAFAGLAALCKLNAVLLLAGYGFYAVVLWAGKKEKLRGALVRILASGAGFAATFGLLFGLMAVFVPGTLSAALGAQAAKAKIAVSSLFPLWGERLIQFLGNHNYGLIAVALLGIIFRPARLDRKRLLLLTITVAVLVQILMPVTFYLRYVVLALIPLAFFFGDGIRVLGSWRKTRPWMAISACVAAGILVLLCLGPAFNLKKLRAYDRGTREVAAAVERMTAPGDYIFGETPFANFYARRPCPPNLVDTSMARTASGQITPADIRRECERYRVKMILVERGHAAHALKNLIDYSEFQSYLDSEYTLVKSMPREFLDVDLYLRKN